MKKTFILFLTFCIMVTSISIITANAEEPQYTYNEKTRTLTINYFNGSEPWADIEYPETIILKSGIINIPSTVFAFSKDGNSGERRNYYDRIKTVKIPNTVKTIGDYAFYDCKKLKNINIPTSVTNIGDCAFYGTNLNRITISGNVSSINYSLFSDCYNLENVELRNGIKKIEFGAFSKCKSLKEIKLPESLISIGQGALSECVKLSKIELPDSLKRVEMFAFIGCTNLEKVIIPKNVSKIDTMAFGYKDQGVKIKNFKIKGYVGSVAKKYADDNNFKFLDITVKEKQTIKITSKVKTIKAKKLIKKAQKINPLTIKNAVGNVKYTLTKKGTSKKLWKFLKINNKSVITVNKWKKAKKGTYNIKIKVTASGNWEYKKFSKTKTVKVKIK